MLEAASEGYAAIDCGATSSIGGVDAVEKLAGFARSELNRDTIVDVNTKIPFRFGNGSRQSTISSVKLPANLVGKDGSVNMNVIDAEAPAPHAGHGLPEEGEHRGRLRQRHGSFARLIFGNRTPPSTAERTSRAATDGPGTETPVGTAPTSDQLGPVRGTG